MNTFKEFIILQEDPLAAIAQMRNKVPGQEGSTVGNAAGWAARAGLDAVTHGIGGNLVDAGLLIRSFFQNKHKAEEQQLQKLTSLEAQLKGMQIPQNLIDIDPGLFDALSISAFITIMTHVITDLRALNGNYNDPKLKNLFHRRAKMFANERFGNVPG